MCFSVDVCQWRPSKSWQFWWIEVVVFLLLCRKNDRSYFVGQVWDTSLQIPCCSHLVMSCAFLKKLCVCVCVCVCACHNKRKVPVGKRNLRHKWCLKAQWREKNTATARGLAYQLITAILTEVKEKQSTVILQIFGALKFQWQAIAELSVQFKGEVRRKMNFTYVLGFVVLRDVVKVFAVSSSSFPRKTTGRNQVRSHSGAWRGLKTKWDLKLSLRSPTYLIRYLFI